METNSFKAYKWRFVNLTFLCLAVFSSTFQAMLYAAIGNIITKFYNVSYTAVSFTMVVISLVEIFVSHIFGIITAKIGFGPTMMISAMLNAFGACVKCIAVERNFFPLLIFGQVFIAASVQFNFILIPFLGTSWFRQNELEIMQGIVYSCLPAGMVFSFLSLIVFKNVNTIYDINERFVYLSTLIAAVQVLIFFATLIFVKNKPPTPPSRAEQIRNEREAPSYTVVFKNLNYIILVITGSSLVVLEMGMFISLNQSLFDVYKEASAITVIAGILRCIGGIFGSMLAGLALKKYSKYRLIFALEIFLLALSYVLFTVGLWVKMATLIYISTFIGGITSVGSITVCMTFIVELTYPVKESVTAGVFYVFANSATVFIVPLVAYLISKFGAVKGNILLPAIGVVAFVLGCFVKEDLRRKRANAEKTNETSPLAAKK
ncbi:putative MFS-type transporter C09D4.1-like protein [Dinothrombium tinctorium]|uniref:Putative MFS-type transporter C09D4.1-like protein n=1 Tax=Dinothrombium tinctorium TaxID=1965070 RepID=A0A3S3QDV2_9ACAR|nr:putative MFS-type transporter C09D4.1-like protein [Dinothrombium tinctorium]